LTSRNGASIAETLISSGFLRTSKFGQTAAGAPCQIDWFHHI